MNRLFSVKGMYLLLLILLIGGMHLTAVCAEKPKNKSEEQKSLERQANADLRRLKYAVKTGGFYNARVALNIWKSTAMEAGIFDESVYNELKRKIYEKSVAENLKWFDIFIAQKNYREAGVCLRLYRMHAEEIGILDEKKYAEMEDRLTPSP
jgi:hypothetical protein